jgi:hypothetical protein
MIRREFHMVYGDNGIKPQGWEESAIGWKQVDPDDWPNGSYRVVEWPYVIPEPVKAGPPREIW